MALPKPDESPPGFLWRWFRSVGADVRDRRAPVTTGFVGFVAVIFLEQVAAAHLAGVAVADVADYLFAEYSVWAWVLSAFVHRGVLHFGTNVLLLVLLGRVVEDAIGRRSAAAEAGSRRDRATVEAGRARDRAATESGTWRDRAAVEGVDGVRDSSAREMGSSFLSGAWLSYLWLLLVAAAGSTAGGALLVAAFTDRPFAVYGASGVGYALATYSLWLPALASSGATATGAPTVPRIARADGSLASLRERYRLEHLLDGLRPGEEFAMLVGVAAVANVCFDVLTGPYMTAYWINGGHAAGAVVGIVVGWWHWRRSGPS